MIMWRKLVGPGLAAALLVATGCAREEKVQPSAAPPSAEVRQETPAPSSAGAQTEGVQTYRLEVQMLGLIAFAHKDGVVWALLPKADYTPGSLPEEAALPQFVRGELAAIAEDDLREEELEDEFPPHFARLRFDNAVVTRGGVTLPASAFPLSLKGKDVQFLDLPTGLSADPDLALLADANAMIDNVPRLSEPSHEGERQKVSEIGKLDLALLEGDLDPRLAARVRLDFGAIEARENSSCPDRRFNFRSHTDPDGCSGDAPRRLAEETIATLDGLAAGFRIRLGPGEELAVQPVDRSKPLEVKILNQTNHAGPVDCQFDTNHLGSFRWFYRLSRPSSAASVPVDLHFYPCQRIGPKGGNKCPQASM
jgi:hypothetical protein